MNKKILTLGLILAMVLAFSCKKDDKGDDDILLLGLLYINDQASGNCATVAKSGNGYDASITPIPKGGCKIDSTRAAALESLRSLYTRIIAVLTKVGSDCSTTAATLTTLSNNLTESSVTGQTNDVLYANSVANRRTFSVGSLVTEAALSLTAAGTDATKAKPATFDQYILTFASEFSTGACRIAVQAQDTALFEGIKAKTIVTSSTCSYGTRATATNRCATLNEQF